MGLKNVASLLTTDKGKMVATSKSGASTITEGSSGGGKKANPVND
jgi:hypothetical protein